ncbi:MAG: hypothetical protein P1P63_04995 [Treponemataceae bacterium]
MKITNEIKKRAQEVAEKNGLNVVFVNDKGEFFSNENFAALSVKSDKQKYAKIEVAAVSDNSDEKKGTNDLDTVAEVVAAIEAATEVEAVEAILKAETEGKNRKTVLEAGAKKIAQLTKTDE